ncbi:MAG: hypothetical protein KC657_25150 [Myxococcales bacterium]|nr:hypothetical protein [Myxococcales bacterium]
MDLPEQTATLSSLFSIPASDLKKATKLALSSLLRAFDADARKSIVDAMTALASNKTGGVFAIWKPEGKRTGPVVYVGSEGDFRVAAYDVEEFLGLLAYGAPALMDCMKVAFRQVTTPTQERAADADMDALEAAVKALAPDADLAAKLAGASIPSIPDPYARVLEANEKWLWPLLDFIENTTTGIPSFHLWYEAFDRPEKELPGFSMDKQYAIGDTFLHSKFGRAIVVNTPQPGRIIVSFGPMTRMLGCAN